MKNKNLSKSLPSHLKSINVSPLKCQSLYNKKFKQKIQETLFQPKFFFFTHRQRKKNICQQISQFLQQNQKKNESNSSNKQNYKILECFQKINPLHSQFSKKLYNKQQLQLNHTKKLKNSNPKPIKLMLKRKICLFGKQTPSVGEYNPKYDLTMRKIITNATFRKAENFPKNKQNNQNYSIKNTNIRHSATYYNDRISKSQLKQYNLFKQPNQSLFKKNKNKMQNSIIDETLSGQNQKLKRNYSYDKHKFNRKSFNIDARIPMNNDQIDWYYQKKLSQYKIDSNIKSPQMKELIDQFTQ